VLNALAHGAHASWNALTAQTVDPAAASLHVLADETLALAPWLSELGNVDLRLRETCGKLSRPDLTALRNQSALFIDMFKGLEEQREVGDAAEWRRIPDKVAEIAARMPGIGDSQMQNELRHTLQVARFAAERGSLRRRTGGISPQDRKRLRAMLGGIVEEHRRLWLLRSREGGLEHSCSFYEKIGESLGGEA